MNNEAMSAFAEIEKLVGKGNIQLLNSPEDLTVDVISTKIPSIDRILGVNGFPKGKIIEIFGKEGSGKSSLMLQTVAEAQKKGELCAYLDSEHALDPAYAKKLGVDLDQLFISQPSSAEETFEIVEKLVNSGKIGLIVVDSIAALVPQAEINGDFGDSIMGVKARLLGQAMRKLTGPISNHNVCFVCINQVRSNLGITWGSPQVTPGGSALKFHSSMRLEITKTGQIKAGEDVIGSKTRLKVIKNRLGPPFKECEVEIYFGEGVCRYADILDSAIELGIIQQKGAWFSMDGTNLGQGREKVRQILKENTAICQQVEDKIYEAR